MGQTVFFTSRMIGDPVRTLDVRCDELRFEQAPDVVRHGAGGDVERSIMPRAVTLVNADRQDIDAMLGVEWTHIGWNEGAQTVEHELRSRQLLDADLRCSYRA